MDLRHLHYIARVRGPGFLAEYRYLPRKRQLHCHETVLTHDIRWPYGIRHHTTRKCLTAVTPDAFFSRIGGFRQTGQLLDIRGHFRRGWMDRSHEF